MAASPFGEAATSLSVHLATRTNNGSHRLPFFLFARLCLLPLFCAPPPLMSA